MEKAVQNGRKKSAKAAAESGVGSRAIAILQLADDAARPDGLRHRTEPAGTDSAATRERCCAKPSSANAAQAERRYGNSPHVQAQLRLAGQIQGNPRRCDAAQRLEEKPSLQKKSKLEERI